MNINVKDPRRFSEKLREVMTGIYELFELTREHELSPVSDDGVIRYIEEHGKVCFQVSGQFNRPSEFLQALLDIVRANYEPCVLGTFFLNSNMIFLYDQVPEAPFQLGYISIVDDKNKPFSRFWHEDVLPYIEVCGYTIDDASAIYAVASTGEDKYQLDFMVEIADTLGSGFSADEAVGLLAASVSETIEEPTRHTYAGYCLDEALGNDTRLSLWLFLNSQEQAVH